MVSRKVVRVNLPNDLIRGRVQAGTFGMSRTRTKVSIIRAPIACFAFGKVPEVLEKLLPGQLTCRPWTKVLYCTVLYY